MSFLRIFIMVISFILPLISLSLYAENGVFQGS